MAIIYVRSTDGNNADNGSTWALAKATLAGAAAVAVAGDTVYVSQAHAETDTTGLTITWAGTKSNPVKIICANDSAEPPTATANTASVTRTTGPGIVMEGSWYSYGVSYKSATALTLGATSVHSISFEDCELHTGSQLGLTISVSNSSQVWRKVAVRFNSSTNFINIGSRLHWIGGSIVSGSVTPNNMFGFGNSGRGAAFIDGLDLTNLSAGVNICLNTNSLSMTDSILRNVKLPASWSGVLVNGAFDGPGLRVKMHNADSGDTNYRFWEEDNTGSIKSETSVYRTGGATDGTTPISWRMASSAGTIFPMLTLASPELPAVWNTAVGSSKTATVEIVHDGATPLNDGEVWVEFTYLGTSGVPLGTIISDRKTLLATGTAQTTSAAAWTGDTGTGPNGSATWNTLKLECTFTPQEAGYIQARVFVAKPSTTVFVDPKITVA